MVPVSVEENLKLLAAYCVTKGDIDAVAKYMEITKNAVSKRFAKLTADEKEAMEKAGILTAGAAAKKRGATGTTGVARAKKVKTSSEEADAGADESDGPKFKKEVDAGDVVTDESEAEGDEA